MPSPFVQTTCDNALATVQRLRLAVSGNVDVAYYENLIAKLREEKTVTVVKTSSSVPALLIGGLLGTTLRHRPDADERSDPPA